LPDYERAAVVARLARDEAGQWFDLNKNPPLHAVLVQLGPSEHVLLLTIHHIASDDWSEGILIDEITSLYNGFIAGKPPALRDPAIQYGDFAHWQRRMIQGGLLESQLNYWKTELSGNLPPLEIPTKCLANGDSLRYDCVTYHVRTSEFEALTQVCKREHVTLFMLLAAGFKTLLHRWTGATDIRLGTVIAGRNRLETENVVGLFANTLVLRSDFSGHLTLRDVLIQVRNVTLHAFANQDLPFDSVVEAFSDYDDSSRFPFFQVMLIHRRHRPHSFGLEGLEIEWFSADSALGEEPAVIASACDLLLQFEEAETEAILRLRFREGLFERAAGQQIMADLCKIMAQFVTDMETPARRYPT
jgi:hypothetical protein